MALETTTRRKNKSSSRRKTARRIQKPRQLLVTPIGLVRLAIALLGASTIAGTVMSIINPPQKKIESKIEEKIQTLSIDALKLQRENPELKIQLQAVTIKNSSTKLDVSYQFVSTDSGEYSSLGADRPYPAANTIKLPILIALFQDLDLKKIDRLEKVTIDPDSILSDGGDLSAVKPGTQITVEAAMNKMMTANDNTATNLLIRRLGGQTALNQRFWSWGLKTTTINHPLPDLEGTNLTTANELASLMTAIDRGKIVSDRARSEILLLMKNSTLSQNFGESKTSTNKSNRLSNSIASIGAIELPSGKIYIAAVLVKSPDNDRAAPELVRELSKIADRHFTKNTPTPSPGFPTTTFIKTTK